MTNFDSTQHPRENAQIPGAFSATVKPQAEDGVVSGLSPDRVGVPIGTPLDNNLHTDSGIISRNLVRDMIANRARVAEESRRKQKDLTSMLLNATVDARFPTASQVAFGATSEGPELLRVADSEDGTLWGCDGDGTVFGVTPGTDKLDRGVSDEIEEVLRWYGDLEDAVDSEHILSADAGQYEFRLQRND